MESNYRACFAVFTGFPLANSRFLTLAITLPTPPLPTPASDWQATRSNQSSGSPPSLRAASQWRRPEGGANANVLAGETQRFIHSSFSSFSPHSERGELPRRLSYTRRSPTEPEKQTLCRENSPRRAQGRGKAFGFLRSFLFSPPSSSQGYRVSTRCFCAVLNAWKVLVRMCQVFSQCPARKYEVRRLRDFSFHWFSPTRTWTTQPPQHQCDCATLVFAK